MITTNPNDEMAPYDGDPDLEYEELSVQLERSNGIELPIRYYDHVSGRYLR